MVRFLHGTNQTETTSRTSSTAEITQRDRKNGWSCPWHPLQLIAWFFLVFFAITYLGILVSYLPTEWRPAGYIIPGGIYVIHFIVHIFALSIDPADPNIRQGSQRQKSLFDRNVHAHVIENNHCHICAADVFPSSKHCSCCNKCVSDFDHHCKWLNTCVGGRNYKFFIGCISTAFLGSLVMAAVTLYIFILFFTDKESLLKTQSGNSFKLFVAVTDDAFAVFVGICIGLHVLALCLLGHLLGFHLYLMYMNIGTYDFIVNSRDRKADTTEDSERMCEGSPIVLKRFRNNKVKPSPEAMENGELSVDTTQQENPTSMVEASCETTVKVMNEVSSKVVKRTLTQDFSQDQVDDSADLVTHEGAKQHREADLLSKVSSSVESLREVDIPKDAPLVTVQRPFEVIRTQDNMSLVASTSSDRHAQDNDVTIGSQSQSPRQAPNQSQRRLPAQPTEQIHSVPMSMVINPGFAGQSGGISGVSGFANPVQSDSDGEELVPVNKEQYDRQTDNLFLNDTTTKKKRKKQIHSPANDEDLELVTPGEPTRTNTPDVAALPPLVTTRPLPPLGSYSKQDSPC